jgi:hypothetical protein
MEVHVLNGDALAEKFPIKGNIVVCRECLLDGPVDADLPVDFWTMRAEYLSENVAADKQSYFADVKMEFEKLTRLQSPSTITLWFEHDLFCQVNMWFVLSFLKHHHIAFPVYRVLPPSTGTSVCTGFGNIAASDLPALYDQRIKLSDDDRELGENLWNAYRDGDLKKLKSLSVTASASYPLLDEICDAHIQRFSKYGYGRPQARLKQIVDSGVSGFSNIFAEFQKTEGIYGFGDVQVKSMLSDILPSASLK